MPVHRDFYRQRSVLSLIAANTLPLLGCIFLGWDVFMLIFFYWLESAIIAFYQILKLFKVEGPLALLTAGFFIFHFGAFMAGHFLFLVGVFAPDIFPPAPQPSFPVFAAKLIRILIELMLRWETVVVVVALFISHGISYKLNFLGLREYETADGDHIVGQCYTRIVIMQLTIILGGMLVKALGPHILGYGLLVVLKTASDLWSHVRQHKETWRKGPQ